MVLEQFTPGVALLAILSTVVLAPMIEEMLFRGVIQRWLSRLLRGAVITNRRHAEPDGRPAESMDASDRCVELRRARE